MDVKILNLNIPSVGTSSGYGINFRGSSPVVVGTVSPESVADQGGLKYGDYIVELNGNDVQWFSKEAVISVIKSNHRGPLKVRIGRVRPIPITTKDKEMAVRILQDKLSGVKVSSSEVIKYEATLKNSLLEVEDLLGSFDLSSFNNQPAKAPPTRTALTKSTSAAKTSKSGEAFEELEVALYDSDSLPSPPSSDDDSSGPDPRDDKLLDFSLDDDFSYNPSFSPRAKAPDHSTVVAKDDGLEAPRIMKAMLQAKHGVEGMKEIIQDVTEAKRRKEEEKRKISLKEVSSTFEPSRRRQASSDNNAAKSGRPSSDVTAKSGRPSYDNTVNSGRPSSDVATKSGRPSNSYDNSGRPSSDLTTKSGKALYEKSGRPSSDVATERPSNSYDSTGRPSSDVATGRPSNSYDSTVNSGRPSSDLTTRSARPSYEKSSRPSSDNLYNPSGSSPKSKHAPYSVTRTHPAPAPPTTSTPAPPTTSTNTNTTPSSTSHPLSLRKQADEEYTRAPYDPQRTQMSGGYSRGGGGYDEFGNPARKSSAPLLPPGTSGGRHGREVEPKRHHGGDSSKVRRTPASPPPDAPTESSKVRRTPASPPPEAPTNKKDWSSKFRRMPASPPPDAPTVGSKVRRTPASPPPEAPSNKKDWSSKFRRTRASPPPDAPTESSKVRRTPSSPPAAPTESSKVRRTSTSPPLDASTETSKVRRTRSKDAPPKQSGFSPPPPQVPSYNPVQPDRFPLSNKEEYRMEYKMQRHSYEDVKTEVRSKSRSSASSPPPPSEMKEGVSSPPVPMDVPHRRKKKEKQNGSPMISHEKEFVGERRVSGGGRGKLKIQAQEEVKVVKVTDVASMGVACDGLPRSVYEWEHEEVCQWLRQLSPSLYKLYKPNFVQHDIIGRTLVRLNTNKMKSIGIIDAKHSRALAMEITRLKVHQEKMELEELQTEKELSFL